MDLNRCSRCGCFFVTNTSVCPGCEQKDTNELATLKNFLQENECNSIEIISSSTGISFKNLNRFLAQDEFADFSNNFGITKSGNISIQL